MKNSKREIFRRATIIIMGTAFIAALLLIIVLSKLLFDVGVVCPFYEIFGWNCPGCGGTRMAVSLLHGDFYQAFRWNPFVFISIPILTIIYIWQSYVFIVKNLLISWIDKFLIIYALLLIIFGIIRNVSIFSWLSPTLIV